MSHADNLRSTLTWYGARLPSTDFANIAAAVHAISAIETRHQPGDYFDSTTGMSAPYAICGECGRRWPCPTSRLLHAGDL